MLLAKLMIQSNFESWIRYAPVGRQTVNLVSGPGVGAHEWNKAGKDPGGYNRRALLAGALR